MQALDLREKAFKRAMIWSASVHLALFILIILSPYFPQFGRKETVHYVNIINLGGGGGRPGGGGRAGGGTAPEVKTEAQAETAVPERESLRDLTTPQKMDQAQPPSMTYPVDKPKRDVEPKAEKKGVIQKAQPRDADQKTQAATKAGSGTSSGQGGGTGSRVGLGLGDGDGFGFGGSYGQIGMSTFPYNYYLQVIHSKISSNWVTALIRSGTSGNLATEVSFRIFRSGRISEPEIRNSSGNRTMDLSAIRAIRNSSPFPPLPSGYEDEYLIVRLIFEHTK